MNRHPDYRRTALTAINAAGMIGLFDGEEVTVLERGDPDQEHHGIVRRKGRYVYVGTYQLHRDDEVDHFGRRYRFNNL